MKRFLTLLAFMVATISSYAYYDFVVGGIYYLRIGDGDNRVWVTSGDKEYQGAITIPEKITYNGVTYSVTSILESAFSYCTSLTSVTIPNSVTSIGDCAFLGSGLSSVTIGNSVKSIGLHAFQNCESLTSFKVENGNTNYSSLDNVILNKDKTEIVCCAGGKKGEYTIPNSVKSIGISAFSSCSGLTSVTIPNSVTSIGESAFEYCSGLTSITIPNSVKSIGDGAFSGCSNLASVNMPNSVTSIGMNVFLSCRSLTSVIIPNSVKTIGTQAFYGCVRLNSIEIPNSVTSIGKSAFNSCLSLTSVTIPNSVNSIGSQAFLGCSNLVSIEIPHSVMSIGEFAFSSCTGLTSVTIPNSVASIGASPFRACSALTSILVESDNSKYDSRDNCNAIIETSTNTLIQGCNNTIIPSSVTSIGDYAFYYFSNLEELTCLAHEVPTLGSNVFYRTKYNTTSGVLYVPNKSVEKYKATNLWKNWTSIVGIKESLELTDGEAYTNDEEKTYDELSFKKTFSSSVVNKWNALYVPISINIEDYLDDFDFAEIFNISPTEDTNGDGEIDGRDANKLIVNKLKTGTTDPNKPYLIRPKNAGTYTFASADNILYPAEEKSYSCSTMTDEYTFTGLYASQGVTGNDKYYMTINGILDFSPTKTITVKPNRWIMTVKSRNGSTSPANAKAISLSVIGEDEGTTAIEHVDAVRNDGNIYNLNGVKMDSKNLPAGIYIKNGKKVLVK